MLAATSGCKMQTAEEEKDPRDYPGDVRLVIGTRKRLLAVRESSGVRSKWLGLPGGSIEFGETAEEAAIREAEEELGLMFQPGELKLLHKEVVINNETGERNFKRMVYGCLITNRRLESHHSQGNEGEFVYSIPYRELNRPRFNPNHKDRIRKIGAQLASLQAA